MWVACIGMPARMVSLGFSKLCHNMSLSDDRTTRLPLLRSLAEELLPVIVFAIQSMWWPLFSDNIRLELPVIVSIADEASVIGLSRLATQTMVRNGISLNHMPTYVFSVEFEGVKKSKANEPWSEVRVLSGASLMPGTSTLTGAHRSTELKGQGIRSTMMTKWRKGRCMLTHFFELTSDEESGAEKGYDWVEKTEENLE